ncbi:phosphatidylglycerol lysyltransferase domain-containing protein [Microvirga arsenatis]|uniref:DUF2156 domain-containing protein n=1 Tax=Microvirga arsenatis TaxID=2692265 RepID=A0ABW9YT31_9HYPH|nr:phosphatidylglycerol lysyltransferase domain-containing protein [Microvirga arsenatis]NBJ10060.1 DUF2156 domain-containing protein [Microvirga arsenatis]NBJ23128.1 DUF2156 domain-containing protein [Microvirga arsenatis]
MLTIPSDLSGLRRIEVSDYKSFAEASAQHQAQSWLYYFPYLYFSGMCADSRALLFEQMDGSILVYVLQKREGGLRLSLFLPPFPFASAPLRRALERVRDFNHSQASRIVRVQENDALVLLREGLQIKHQYDEYVYDCAAVLALKGSSFEALRRKIRRYANDRDVNVRKFRKEDQQICLSLRRKWYENLLNCGVKVGLYNKFTPECLARSEVFTEDVLIGQVVEVGGTIRAFSFGGAINQSYGSIFITISDHDFPGLAYLQRYHLMKAHPQLVYFNDFSDSGRSGLAQMKRTFRPAKMHGMYSAKTH